MNKLSLGLAILAAGSNAASNTLQRMADRDEPPEVSMRLQLIIDLVHRPVWLAGFATVLLSFVLDAAALSMGQLAAVQPVLVLELPLTLIAASRLFGTSMSARDWVAIAVMTSGLAGLILFLAPSASHTHQVSVATWLVGIAVTAAAVAVCVAASSRGGAARRPALLGLASGISFGLTAAFMKSATGSLHHSAAAIFHSWPTYAMGAAGLVAFFLMQNALQAGPLFLAQPGITLADPGVAILWGVIVFGEQTRHGVWLLAAALSGVALAAGTLLLTRSPLLHQEPTRRSQLQAGAAVDRRGTG